MKARIGRGNAKQAVRVVLGEMPERRLEAEDGL